MTQHEVDVEDFANGRGAVGRPLGRARMALGADFSDGRITQAGNVEADLADHAVEPGQDDVGTLHRGDVLGNGCAPSRLPQAIMTTR